MSINSFWFVRLVWNSYDKTLDSYLQQIVEHIEHISLGKMLKYVKSYDGWCNRLSQFGYLLEEDVMKLRASRERFRPWFEGLDKKK